MIIGTRLGEVVAVIKLRDAERLLRQAGFRVVSGSGKGSHVKWRHDRSEEVIIVPLPKGDVLPHYMEKQIQEAIRAARGEEN